MAIFLSLLATRTDRIGSEHLRSLSLIDVTFNKYPRVKAKWASYYESLNNPGMNNDNGAVQRQTKFNDMLAEMARALGYGKDVGFEEITRSYKPQGVVDNAALQRSMQSEFIRVLKNTENMGHGLRNPAPSVTIPTYGLLAAMGAVVLLILAFLFPKRSVRARGENGGESRSLPRA
jgi:hypothetical protein